jgi:hypothetical protein
MICTKEELQQRVKATPVASNGRLVFSPELRRDVVTYSTARRAQTGESISAVAEGLGLKGWTVQRWHQNENKARVSAAFVEVKAPRRTALRPGSFKVTCPSGYEVRVPASFEAGPLRELLAVLGR